MEISILLTCLLGFAINFVYHQKSHSLEAKKLSEYGMFLFASITVFLAIKVSFLILK